MLEAAKRCGLLDEMKWAGYNRPNEQRTHSIKPTSFGRLARAELAGAQNAISVLLRGERDAKGSYRESIVFGGTSSALARGKRTAGVTDPTYPYKAFDADFYFPMIEYPKQLASELIRTSVQMLDAEYGYYFVRDDLCFPTAYTEGIGAALDYSKLDYEDTAEVARWRKYVSDGELWTDPWPKFRDLFEVNLISERHTSVRVEGLGYLTDWIAAQAGRGQLEHLGRGRLLWSLSDAEMVEVRPVLNDAGLLVSCRKRVYRDLTPGFRARLGPLQKAPPKERWRVRS